MGVPMAIQIYMIFSHLRRDIILAIRILTRLKEAGQTFPTLSSEHDDEYIYDLK